MPAPIAKVSVMPQPVSGSAFARVASMRATCSGARGAPPPPTEASEDRSCRPSAATRSRSPVTAAGATTDTSRSRSTSVAAASGSHLYMHTTRRCARYDASSDAASPVTWNSGTASSVPSCPGASEATVPVTRSPIARSSSHDSSADRMLRCVETTPFG